MSIHVVRNCQFLCINVVPPIKENKTDFSKKDLFLKKGSGIIGEPTNPFSLVSTTIVDVNVVSD